MANKSTPWLRSFAAAAMLTIFVLQFILCQTGLAGSLLESPQHLDNCCQNGNTPDETNPQPAAPHCHSTCHQPISLLDTTCLSQTPALVTEAFHHAANERCPDGPCGSIDLPPLISC